MTAAARQMFFVDSRVADYQTLIAGLAEGSEWHLLHAGADGIRQMERILSAHTGLDAIQVISHGAPGTLYLGSTMLTAGNLASYEATLQAIGRSLSETGDILLYGCSVAQGDGGQAFIAQLAAATGADVAASTDLTGKAALGGDWVMERSTGAIDNEPLSETKLQSTYAGLLAAILGNYSSEALSGTSGNDTIDGQGGNDTIDGGAGTDTAIFFEDRANFTVTTLSGVTRVYHSGGSGRYAYDELFLTNVEKLQFADATVAIAPSSNTLVIGTYFAEGMSGTGANETFDGRGGDDIIDGGAGTDTVIFFEDRANFTVTTLSGVTRVHHSGGSGRYAYDELFLTNVEKLQFADATVAIAPSSNTLVIGTYFAEGMSGTGANETFDGRGGNDTIDGGAGTDTVIFFEDRANFTVTTLSGVTRVYHSGGSGRYAYDELFLTNVEKLQFADATVAIAPSSNTLVIGTYFAEGMSGTGANETFDGRGGDDIIDGGAGTDTVIFFEDRANFTVTTLSGVTRVHHSGGSGRYAYDELFLTNVEKLQFADATVAVAPSSNTLVIGTYFAEGMSGTGANETFDGRGGNDTIDGGAGTDTVIFFEDRANFTVTTLSGVTRVYHSGGSGRYAYDELFLTNVEKLQFADATVAIAPSSNTLVIGTYFAEGMSGTGANETFDGRGGNDTIDGGAGTDTVIFFEDRANFTVTTLSGVTRVYHSGGSGRYAYDELFLTNVEKLQFADATVAIAPSSNTLVIGTYFAEGMSGTGANETFDGRGGDDIIDGGAGTDTVIFFEDRANFTVTTLSGVTRVHHSGGSGRYAYDELFLTNVEKLQFADATVAIAPSSNTLVIGTYFAEGMSGTGANETFDGRGGNDTIDGGAGTDTVIFFEDRANFTVTTLSGVTRVYHSGGSGRYAYDELFLTNVEKLQFADTTTPLMYSISPGSATVGEGAGTVSFTVARSGLLPAETVYVSTTQSEGTPNIGDYTGKLNEVLSFAAGETSKTVMLSITNDTVLENDETFGLVVQRDASDLLNTYLAKSTFTIHSDDAATLDDYSSTTATTGTISSGQTKRGAINFIGDTDWFKTSLVAGTAYQFELKGASSGSGTLKDPFLRLRDSDGNPVALAFADDGGTGFDSRFTFTPQTNGTYFLAAGTGYQENGMGTYALTQSVRTNAAGTSYKLTPQSPAVGEASGTLTFTLTRSGVMPSETVYASTVHGLKNGYADNTGNSDYNGLNNLGISFAAGQPSKTLSINIRDDALAEGNETFGVIIQAAPDPSINNWLARSSFTIVDNEPGLSSFRLSPQELVGDEATGHITVTLTRPAGLAPETVYVSTAAQPGGPANDADYVERNQYPVVFGQNEQTQSFDIQLLKDSVSEPREKFNLSVWRSANQNPQDLIFRSPFTIVDADDPSAPPLDRKSIFQKNDGMVGVLSDLMLAAYRFNDSFEIAQTFSKLKINALDLGSLAGYQKNGVFVNGNASAIVGRSSDAIFLSFTGTDEFWDKLGPSGWLQRENHFRLFDEFVVAVDQYASASGIKHIYVTGHSLGAAMAQAYMQKHPKDPKDGSVEYEAIVFANPGYGESLGGIGIGLNQPDTRMANILIEGDIIAVPDTFSPRRGDLYIVPTERSTVAELWGANTFDLHSQELYHEIGRKLEKLPSEFPDPASAQDLAIQTLFVPGMYVDATKAKPSLVYPQSQGAATTYALMKDASGQSTGFFSFANSTPVTVDMGAGQVSSTALHSVVGIGATGVAAVGAGVVLVGTPIKNLVVGSAVKVAKGLSIIGTALGNFIRGGHDDYIYAGGGDDIIDIGIGDGPDVYDGGDGVDTVIYASTTLGVVINLPVLSNNATGIEIDVDQIANIENVVGGSGPDRIIGSNVDNDLKGMAGNDTLDGGAGADSMTGGDGNDFYYVDHAGDVVSETNATTAGGIDLVFTTVASYTLGAQVENARILATGAANLTGNALDNLIYAGIGNNVLNGGAGSDTVTWVSGVSGASGVTASLANGTASGSGNDTLIGIEHLIGSSNADRLTGNGNANKLSGGLGNDTLDGGAGADSMTGGDGNDFYYVDHAGDVVSETNATASGGTDLVFTTVASYILGAHVENARILAAGAANLTGNALDNLLYAGLGNNVLNGGAGSDTVTWVSGVSGATGITASLASGSASGSGNDTLIGIEHLIGSSNGDRLTGNGNANRLSGGLGNDTLDGGAGADSMTGGDGNDFYYVDHAGDVVSETSAAAGGIDLVFTTVASYILGAHVENARILATGAANLTGNALDNLLYAGIGNNVLDGGTGSDTVTWVSGASGASGVTASLASGSASGSGNDTLIGIEHLIGSSNADRLTGNGNANKLSGGLGNDTLDGGAGADSMTGGDGNDFYYVDHAGDVVSETSAAAGGIDLVFTTVASYTLGAHVENARILATGAANLTGNALDNLIYAGIGNNVLNGGAGSDTVTWVSGVSGASGVTASLASGSASGSGNDNLIGIEHLIGSSNADRLTGNGNANRLGGGLGNDTLDGGAGADSMTGGDGNDFYYVDHAGDVVSETNAAAAGGTDLVFTTVASYTLGAHVENARILASGAANLTGNTLDNLLYAGLGNNVLNGGAGSDTVTWVSGVSGASGVTASLASGSASGSGTDTLIGIEHLVGSSNADRLTGDGNANKLSGGLGNDTLDGGGGADRLLGGLGNDSLIGGNGADIFRFDTLPDAASNRDTIGDYSVVDDTIELENAIFSSLTTTGALAVGRFRAGAGFNSAADADDYLIYDSSSGALYYDANGNTGAAPVQIASLTAGLALTSLDFLVT
ncbi:MAG: DUF4347 domain-containing protein [Candidatus Accumulibacter similis]|nr:MAG: DUF4347 domain-containing protein [Candidatus Accumulibacter similis]